MDISSAQAMENHDNEYLNTAATARELGVSKRRVQALINSGRLPARKLARDWLILRVDVELVRERRPGRPRKSEDQEAQAKEPEAGDTMQPVA